MFFELKSYVYMVRPYNVFYWSPFRKNEKAGTVFVGGFFPLHESGRFDESILERTTTVNVKKGTGVKIISDPMNV